MSGGVENFRLGARTTGRFLCVVVVFLVCATHSNANNEAVDFDTQIVPILTRSGCNSGACHGAALGRGGFKLSLFGGDPASDHLAIARQLEGRRIHLADPAESLLFKKPTALTEHEGGERFAPDSLSAKLILEWIGAGATRAADRRLTSFTVEPRSMAVQRDEEIVLRAKAVFDDGVQRDVTRWTVWSAEDPSAVTLDDAGDDAQATVTRPGRHVVVARFLDRVEPIELLVPFESTDADSAPSSTNVIDREVNRKLAQLRIPASPACDDATFLRRVRLDLTGTLPSVQETLEFEQDHRDDKRILLVDRLLASDDFNVFWTHRLAQLLRIRPLGKETEGARLYYEWLHEQVAGGVSYRDMVWTLLTATGDTHVSGPPNFHRTTADPRSQAEFISETLMGVRLRCANCHNHPLDRWTQEDYHGLAAMLARIDRGRVVRQLALGEATNPRTGRPAVPKLPGDRYLPAEADRLHALAEWLTADENPYFARAMVNRLWKWMMGRGLVEPTDDLRATNPATHPELLDRLAEDFIAGGHQIRATLKQIACSEAYARSSQVTVGNRNDDRFYSHALTRPLSPEVYVDAVATVTGAAEAFGDLPAGTRAVALLGSSVPSRTLDVLGRCPLEESCDSAGESASTLTKTLHLMNGPFLNEKILTPSGRLATLLKAGTPTDAMVEEFYLCALSRRPSASERKFWRENLPAASDPESLRQALEDFLWSLLSSQEFSTNH